MLVRIEKDWNYPNLYRQSPGFNGTWQGIQFTTDPVADCDLLIVLNSVKRDIWVRCPPGNKWLFTQESPIEQYRWHTESFKYFDKIFTYWDESLSPAILHDQTALPWHVNKSYEELRSITLADALRQKRYAVSWVTSNASHKPGHKLRMDFKDHLVEAGFQFDLFGRGFTPIPDKFDGIYPYKYSIAIENYSCDDYWTEKIADCFLSWTIPIYWGAKNILSFFPEKSIIHIDPLEPERSIAKIREAINGDFFNSNLDALSEARDLILEKYQFFPNSVKLINSHLNSTTTARSKVFIPMNPEHYKHAGISDQLKLRIKRMFKV